MAEVVSAGRDEPLYLQLRRTVLERIERGEYPAGVALPSENDLAEEFSTTRLTVRNAIDELVARGLVRRVQGKGAFVAATWLDNPASTATNGGFRATAKSAGMEPSVRILAKACRYAGDYYAWLFGIEPDDLLFYLRRLNSVDGTPVSLENTYIPLAVFPTIEEVDISVFSLYETYELLGHRVAKAQEKLDLVALTARDAGLLGVEAGSPALTHECVSYDESGRAIELAYSLSVGRFGGYSYSE